MTALIFLLLAAPSANLDSLVHAAMLYNHIPGLAACAVKGESVVWHGEYGFARLEDSIRVTDTTVFDLASVSKTATGVALMQLWERGLFGLDDDINGHLPFRVHHFRYPDSAVTFRMLLTHTSGIADNWAVFGRLQRQCDPDVPLRAFVEGYLVPGGEYYDSIANFHAWPPGGGYSYSNVGIALAGYLVEALADSFHHYTRDSLFRPLGMNRTVWYFRDIDTNTMAMPYRYSGGSYIRYGHQSLPDVPAGTMKSSALQLARFLIAMVNHGRCGAARVLDSATVALMTTVQPPAPIGLVWHPGVVGSREVWQHGGMWNGISTHIAFCLPERSAAVVLCNVGGANGAIQGTILPALFDRAAAISEPAEPVPVRVPARATLTSGLLTLDGARGGMLLDASGRRILELRPGLNDVSGLAPGVYFVAPGLPEPPWSVVIAQ